MRSARSRLLASLAVALALAGCAHRGLPAPPVTTGYALPELPAGLRACFAGTTALPKEAVWTKAQTKQVIASLIRSEGDRTDCGRRAIAFYDDLRERAAK